MDMHSLLSVYCLATSATASLILLRTGRSASLARDSSNFCLMATAWSAGRETNISEFSPLSFLRDFEAIRRKITAAKDRTYRTKVVLATDLCHLHRSAGIQIVRLRRNLATQRSAQQGPSIKSRASCLSSCSAGVPRLGSAWSCLETAEPARAASAPHGSPAGGSTW